MAQSVALKSVRKESDLSKHKFEKETEALTTQLTNLKEYKFQQQGEARKAKVVDISLVFSLFNV